MHKRHRFKKPANLSNGIEAAGNVLKTRPDTLFIDRTKYASGVPGDITLFMYGIHFLRTRRSYTVKLRACSYQKIAVTALKARLRSKRNSGSTLVLQHSQQVFETVAAKLRPSSKLCYDCTPKFECGRSFEHSKLRLYLSLPETILGASLRLY